MREHGTAVMTDETQTKEIIMQGKFDSSKARVSLFLLSAGMLIAGALASAGAHYSECVVLCSIALVLSFFGVYFCRRDERVDFYMTEHFIYRKNFFGRQTVISFDAVRGVELVSFGTVLIMTTYGQLSCHMMSNPKEVFDAITEILDEKTE